MTAKRRPWRRVRAQPMRMLDVKDSSNLAALGYDHESHTLRVRFHDGSEYQYEAVPKATYFELVSAASIGERFASTIKGKFKTWRLRRPRKGAHAS